ncbi:MAG: type II secretion system F family protein [Pseudomonadota bacterium]
MINAQEISNHAQIMTAALVMLSMLCIAITFAWNYVVPNDAVRRLRNQIDGTRDTPAKRDVVPDRTPASAGLRVKPSDLLNKLVALFRISERINDGKLAAQLQQAGFRGRATTVKYLAARIVSPIAFFVLGAIMSIAVLPPHQGALMKVGVIVGFSVLGYFLPPLMLKNWTDKRKIEIGRAWPDAVDLMLICVETGMSIEHAFKKVAEEMAATSIELAKEMSLTNAELSYLQERRQAYENMSKRVDLEAVQAVMTCLIQSEKYGTSLGVSLRVLAQESRAMRMAAAEKKAAALPPKLTVPMIVFFLPVLFAVIITPAALQITGM